jgi:RNA polymerase sigma-70 factor (ECF subfamily)
VDERSDQDLIELTRSGESSAFDLLVRRYQDRLVHSLEHVLSSREDALDIAQQAFLLAWKKLASYRGESSFYSWLYRIAVNAAASHFRRPVVSAGSLDQLHDVRGIELPDRRVATGPGQSLEQEEEIQRVRQALQQVSEEFRQPLILREIEGFSYEQIAEILGIPSGTVRSRIFRARQELMERLDRDRRAETD